MRSLIVHLGILMILAIPGVVVLINEVLVPPNQGGLFQRYDITKLYWLGFLVYAIVSTTIVGLFFIVQAYRRRPFTWHVVTLCHVIPNGLLGLGLYLGVHDTLQEIWQNTTGKPTVVAAPNRLDIIDRKPLSPPAGELKPYSFPQSPTQVLETQKLEPRTSD